MTSFSAHRPCPDPSPSVAPALERVLLRSPSELFGSVPALLGFHPDRSLVLLGLSGSGATRRIELALRTDLPGAGSRSPDPEALAGHLAARGCRAAAAVLVGGPGPESPDPPSAAPRELWELVAALRAACGEHGVALGMTLWTPRLAKGAPWWCFDPCACAGVLSDPAASAVAAAVVASGQVIHPDRAALEGVVAPGAPAVLARRSRLLERALDELARTGDLGPRARHADLALVERWVDASRAGSPELGDDDVVALCLALGDRAVRDYCIGLAGGSRAEAAELLWTTLLREAPDPEAADVATLLAVSALARRDGGLMGVALDRAQRSWPGHRLSELLLRALAAGVAPAEIESWCLTAVGARP